MMKFLLICLVLSTSILHAKEYGNVTVHEIISIYDADTFRVDIEGFPPIAGHRIPVRVLGIDTPEIRGKCDSEKFLARKAKQFTVQSLRSAKIIELKNIQRGKYFRILAEVYLDGESLAAKLIKEGHARIYHGGKRLGWCV